jgi:hypothetical protein
VVSDRGLLAVSLIVVVPAGCFALDIEVLLCGLGAFGAADAALTILLLNASVRAVLSAAVLRTRAAGSATSLGVSVFASPFGCGDVVALVVLPIFFLPSAKSFALKEG